jgi:hypothetical protein
MKKLTGFGCHQHGAVGQEGHGPRLVELGDSRRLQDRTFIALNSKGLRRGGGQPGNAEDDGNDDREKESEITHLDRLSGFVVV